MIATSGFLTAFE